MRQDEKTFHAWLANAHAQELSVARMCTMHAKDNHEYPELSQRLVEYAEQCKKHADQFADCLVRRGGDISMPKNIFGGIMGALLGFSGDTTIDKVIMNNLTDTGMVQFQISSFYTLIAGAEWLKDKETVTVCQEILKESEAMLDWLKDQVKSTAKAFLKKTLE